MRSDSSRPDGRSGGQIDTISYGEERPAVEGHDESAWRFNAGSRSSIEPRVGFDSVFYKKVRGASSRIHRFDSRPGLDAAASHGQGDVEARLARVERLLDGRALVQMLENLEALRNEVQALRGDIEGESKLSRN